MNKNKNQKIENENLDIRDLKVFDEFFKSQSILRQINFVKNLCYF